MPKAKWKNSMFREISNQISDFKTVVESLIYDTEKHTFPFESIVMKWF